MQDLLDLAIDRHPMLPLPQMYELRFSVTAYDDAYVGIAESFGCPLLRATGGWSRRRGLLCDVTLLEE